MSNTPSDPRPAMAQALRALREEGTPRWVTWQERRLRIAPVSEAFLMEGLGEVLLATRRGYRLAELTGRRQRLGKGPEVLVEDGWIRVPDRRVRAVVLENHPRPSSTPGGR